MRTRCLIAAIALCVSGAIAAAEPVRFSDLEGTTLEASWTEALTFRPENESRRAAPTARARSRCSSVRTARSSIS